MSGRATSPEAASPIVSEERSDQIQVGRVKPVHKNFHFQPDAGTFAEGEGCSPERGSHRMVRTLPELMNEARSRKLARLRTMRTAGADILNQEELARKAVESQFLSFWATDIAPEFDIEKKLAQEQAIDRLGRELEELQAAVFSSKRADEPEEKASKARSFWEAAALDILKLVGESLHLRSKLLMDEAEDWSIIHAEGDATKSRLDRASKTIAWFFRGVCNKKRLKLTLREQKYTTQGMDLASLVTNLYLETRTRLVFRARRSFLRDSLRSMISLHNISQCAERLGIYACSYCDLYQINQYEEWKALLRQMASDVVELAAPLVLEQQLPIDEFNSRADILVAQYADLWNCCYTADQSDLYLKAVVAQEALLRRNIETQAAAGVDIDQYLAVLKILPWWLARTKRNIRSRTFAKREQSELRTHSTILIQTAWRCWLARRMRRLRVMQGTEVMHRFPVELEELVERERVIRSSSDVTGLISIPSTMRRLQTSMDQVLEQESITRAMINEMASLFWEGKGIQGSEAILQFRAASVLHLHLGAISQGYSVRHNLAPTLSLLLSRRRTSDELHQTSELILEEMHGRLVVERSWFSSLADLLQQSKGQQSLLLETINHRYSTVLIPNVLEFETIARAMEEERHLRSLSSIFTSGLCLVRVTRGGQAREKMRRHRHLVQKETARRFFIKESQMLEYYEQILQTDLLDEHSEVCYRASRQLAKALGINFSTRYHELVEVDEPAGRSDIESAETRWMSLTMIESDAVLKTLHRLSQDAKNDEQRIVAENKSRRELAEASSKLFDLQGEQDLQRFEITGTESSERSTTLFSFREGFQKLLKQELQLASQQIGVRASSPPLSPPLSDSRKSSEGPFSQGASSYAQQLVLRRLATLEEEEAQARREIYQQVDYAPFVEKYKSMKKAFRSLLMRRAAVLAGLEAKMKKLEAVMEPTIRKSIEDNWQEDKDWESIQDMAKLSATLLSMDHDGQTRLLRGPPASPGGQGTPPRPPATNTENEPLEVLSNEAITDQAMTTTPSSMGPADRKNSGMSNSSGTIIPMLPPRMLSELTALEREEETARQDIVASQEASSSYQGIIMMNETIKALLEESDNESVEKLAETTASKLISEESAARQDIISSVESSASYQQITLFADYVQAALEDEMADEDEDEEVYVVEEVEDEEAEDTESSDDDQDSMASVGSVLWV